MKKLSAILAAVLILALLVSAFSGVSAAASETELPAIETVPQQTFPSEDELAPLFQAPKDEDFGNPNQYQDTI